MRQVIITSILKEFHPKNHFFEGQPWFKFNYLRLALGMDFKFSISIAKSLKLKVRKLFGLILTLAEVTWEKLIREGEILLHILNSIESIRIYGMLKKKSKSKGPANVLPKIFLIDCILLVHKCYCCTICFFTPN